ncbi:MAG: aminomethyltransferase family protein [Candidatus Rokuibacteriota bacterium]
MAAYRLPLHDRHLAAGARFAAPCELELALDYGDPAAEYAAVRSGVGLIDVSEAGLVEVTGRDRATFLHAMLSNDIKGLGPGRGCASAFLDVHGKVQTLLVVWVLEERILLVSPHGMAAKTIGDLDQYLFSEKVVFRDVTGDLTLLLLAGPRAAALVQGLTGTAVPEEPWAHAATKMNGIDARLIRGGAEIGEPDVWVAGAAGGELWTALLQAGARPVGLTARESLRLEAGTPRFGHDVDESVLLPELGAPHLVSNTKGCYLGQEVVVRIRDRGHVNRHLRGLVLAGETVPAPGDAVVVADQEIGRVTSATWSFGLERPLALGFVRRQHAEAGTSVAIRNRAGELPATVTTLPVSR